MARGRKTEGEGARDEVGEARGPGGTRGGRGRGALARQPEASRTHLHALGIKHGRANCQAGGEEVGATQGHGAGRTGGGVRPGGSTEAAQARGGRREEALGEDENERRG
ncbi:hypothetical protein ZWY2020_054550 [Hordeum vulgare]|nr:hypothetical protein ZWY2020_054550 [Hordeum vulgare]